MESCWHPEDDVRVKLLPELFQTAFYLLKIFTAG